MDYSQRPAVESTRDALPLLGRMRYDELIARVDRLRANTRAVVEWDQAAVVERIKRLADEGNAALKQRLDNEQQLAVRLASERDDLRKRAESYFAQLEAARATIAAKDRTIAGLNLKLAQAEDAIHRMQYEGRILRERGDQFKAAAFGAHYGSCASCLSRAFQEQSRAVNKHLIFTNEAVRQHLADAFRGLPKLRVHDEVVGRVSSKEPNLPGFDVTADLPKAEQVRAWWVNSKTGQTAPVEAPKPKHDVPLAHLQTLAKWHADCVTSDKECSLRLQIAEVIEKHAGPLRDQLAKYEATKHTETVKRSNTSGCAWGHKGHFCDLVRGFGAFVEKLGPPPAPATPRPEDVSNAEMRELLARAESVTSDVGEVRFRAALTKALVGKEGRRATELRAKLDFHATCHCGAAVWCNFARRDFRDYCKREGIAR